MSWLIPSMAPLFYCNCDLADFFYCTTVLLQLWLRWFLPLHHCFIAIMTCLVFLLHHCFITIRIRLISFVSPLFYCYYEFVDFFYGTIVLLQLWIGWSLLFHDCFNAIMIWLILFDFYYSTVLLQLWFGWSLPLHHFFIAIIIWLILSIPPLFYCNYDLADFFCCTTGLLQLIFGWFLLWHYYFITIIILLISPIAPLF